MSHLIKCCKTELSHRFVNHFCQLCQLIMTSRDLQTQKCPVCIDMISETVCLEFTPEMACKPAYLEFYTCKEYITKLLL